MRTRIFIVTYASHTDSDDNLYQSVKTFTGSDYAKNERDARELYERQKAQAYEECKWGEYWEDDEEGREDAYEYQPMYSNHDITRAEFDGMLHGSYEVASEAYEGYKVNIEFEEREIDSPCGDIFLFDRERYTEQEAKAMTRAEAEKLAELPKDDRKIWIYHPYCSTFESDWNSGAIDPAKFIIRIIY